ncbi:MAG: GNAT family N-acetyltransferase [Pseudomonadota bacterium]
MSTIALDPPAEFRTNRLILRKPVPDDAPKLFDTYASDPQVARFTTYRPHTHVETVQHWVSGLIARWDERSDFSYVITDTVEPRSVLGMIGMHPGPRWVGFGYALGKPHWHRGIAPEALKVLVDWALAQHDVYRAQAFCDVENVASTRVMEKAGMAREGILKRFCIHPNISPEPRDCLMYARVR